MDTSEKKLKELSNSRDDSTENHIKSCDKNGSESESSVENDIQEGNHESQEEKTLQEPITSIVSSKDKESPDSSQDQILQEMNQPDAHNSQKDLEPSRGARVVIVEEPGIKCASFKPSGGKLTENEQVGFK